MSDRPSSELSLNRVPNAVGSEDGYDLWFDLPPHKGDATTSELQTLCQGAILLGRIAQGMGWDWPTMLRNVDHLSAQSEGHLLLEVGSRLFNAAQFRRALHESVPDAGLDPYKVKV
ncbi:hypothetical protein EON81_29765, partial [bacterium]